MLTFEKVDQAELVRSFLLNISFSVHPQTPETQKKTCFLPIVVQCNCSYISNVT